MTTVRHEARSSDLQRRLFTVIFRSDTPAGQFFDLALIVAILISVATVMLTTVDAINDKYGRILYLLEWFFTLLFSIEYGLRLYCVRNRKGYAKSFLGVIDLLSVLPTYLGVIFAGTAPMLVIRILRVLRLFRIMHMREYVTEANILLDVLVGSWRKTLIFVYAVLTLVAVFGTLMYMIEGEAGGFHSIPDSMYWAIVTLTTVGYGDIVPVTPVGKTIASLIMITGYGIIAVPMGIFFAEFSEQSRRRARGRHCPACGAQGHDPDANYCKACAEPLDEETQR